MSRDRPTIRHLMVATIAAAIVLWIGRQAGGRFGPEIALSLGLGWIAWVVGRRSRIGALAGLISVYVCLPFALELSRMGMPGSNPPAGFAVFLWLYPTILGFGSAWLFTVDPGAEVPDSLLFTFVLCLAIGPLLVAILGPIVLMLGFILSGRDNLPAPS